MFQKYNNSSKRLAAALLCASLIIMPAKSYAQAYNGQQDGAKFAPLLFTIGTAFSSVISSTTNSLFTNLFNRFFNPVNCWANDTDPSQQSISNTSTKCPPKKEQSVASNNLISNQNPGNQNPAFNSVTPIIPVSPVTPAAMSPEEARQKLAQAPAFTVKLEKLEHDQPNSPVKNAIILTRSEGVDYTYDINTNDVFAIKFQTTVPGRIRILNESQGKAEQIGYYEVVPEIDNRMPRSRGMRMNPPSGTEYLIFEFTPCVSSSMESDPRVAAFKPHLGACSSDVATKQFTGKWTQQAGSKAIANLDSPDMTQPVLAARDYTPGQVLTMKITVNHQPTPV